MGISDSGMSVTVSGQPNQIARRVIGLRQGHQAFPISAYLNSLKAYIENKWFGKTHRTKPSSKIGPTMSTILKALNYHMHLLAPSLDCRKGIPAETAETKWQKAVPRAAMGWCPAAKNRLVKFGLNACLWVCTYTPIYLFVDLLFLTIGPPYPFLTSVSPYYKNLSKYT